MKKYKEALEDFEEAKKVDPKTVNVDKNIEEAKKRMGESGGGKVDKAGAKKAMGEANAEFKKGNYEGALKHYTKVWQSRQSSEARQIHIFLGDGAGPRGGHVPGQQSKCLPQTQQVG